MSKVFCAKLFWSVSRIKVCCISVLHQKYFAPSCYGQYLALKYAALVFCIKSILRQTVLCQYLASQSMLHQCFASKVFCAKLFCVSISRHKICCISVLPPKYFAPSCFGQYLTSKYVALVFCVKSILRQIVLCQYLTSKYVA